MKLNFTYMVLIFCSLSITTVAQDTDFFNVGMQSPTAASLGEYGAIPVSKHTGIPSIKVPIYNVAIGDLSVPISLSYHAGGIKVDEIASWVGLGWSLNTGGVITRSMNGGPDEGNNNGLGYLDTSILDTWPSLSATQKDQLIDFEDDTQPDEFFYNVGGSSGKFMFRDDGTVNQFPETDFKISFYQNEFILIDASGTKYTFSDIETTTNANSIIGNPGPYTSSWFLTKIESAMGDHQIDFNYTTAVGILHEYLPSNEYKENSLPSILNCGLQSPLQSSLNRVLTETIYLESITTDKETITFNTSDRDDALNPNDQTKQEQKLDNITISKNGIISEKHVFTYDYYNELSVLSESKRLRLTEVVKEDANSTKLEPYTFEYNQLDLPRRNSYDVDHWGFYNNAGNDESMAYLPNYFGNGIERTDGANREPNETYNKAGILTKLNYPTGGFTEFSYEGNSYSKITSNDIPDQVTYNNLNISTSSDDNVESTQSFTIDVDQNIEIIYEFIGTNTNQFNIGSIFLRDNNGTQIYSDNSSTAGNNTKITKDFDLTAGTYVIAAVGLTNVYTSQIDAKYVTTTTTSVTNKLAGGIRVKQITTNSGMSNSQDIVTDYTYTFKNDITKSSGIITSEPNYFGTMDDGGIDTGVCSYVFITSSSFMPLSTSQGSSVGYKEVKVSTSSNNGYSWSYFKSADEVSDTFIGGGGWSYYVNSYDWKRGYLLKEENYNSTGELLTETIHQYSTDTPLHLDNTKSIRYRIFSVTDKTFGTVEKHIAWEATTYNSTWIKKTGEINRVYDPGTINFLETSISYNYGTTTHQIESTTKVNSDGTESTKVIEYAYNEYNDMETANMLTQPYSIEVQDDLGNPLSKSWTTYHEFATDQWLPKEQWVWSEEDSNDPPDTSNAVKVGEVISYDSYGNPIRVKDANGLETKAFYGNNTFDGLNTSPYSQTGINGTQGIYLTGIQKVLGTDDCSNCGSRPTNSDDLFIEATYDSQGRLRLMESENEVESEFTYDSFNRLISIKNDAGDVISEFDYSLTGSAFSSTNPNWIESRSFSGTDTRSNRQYLDGLGREIQTIGHNGSEALISSIEYNERGLPWKTWKTYDRSGSSLAFDASFSSNAKSAYNNNDYAFVETLYEDSPLQRTSKTIPFGGETEYGAIQQKYSVESINGHNYSRTESIDPDGKKTHTYTDGWGRTFRTISDPGGINAITEFTYDELDRLLEVRPPNYFDPPSGSIASDWEISYDYDKRGNLISKSSSDFGTSYYAYNKANQLRFSQDANQVESEKIAYISYDELGRVIKTGIADYTGDITSLDPDTTVRFENSEDYQKGIFAYDTKPDTLMYPWSEFSSEINGFTSSNSKGQVVADMYRFGIDGIPTTQQLDGMLVTGVESYKAADSIIVETTDFENGSDVILKAGGRIVFKDNFTAEAGVNLNASIDTSLVGTEEEGVNTVTGNNPWQLNLYSYDSEGRLEKKEIHTGDKSEWKAIINYSYNWLGELTRRSFEIGEDLIYHHYEYDGLGRMISLTITADGIADNELPEITYQYTADGQFEEKEYKGGTRMDYDYDIQSRLTSINDLASSAHPFSAAYSYFNNGNIDEAEFRNPLTSLGSDHQRYRYSHSYDNLNRLTSANYENYASGAFQSTNAFKVTGINYDKNGNITQFKRYDDQSNLIDDLTYNYGSSNKLQSISDATTTTTASWDAETATYSYDDNGNMLSQSGKFSSLSYNEYNLPIQINTTSGTNLKANYNGAGQRILKEYSEGTWTYYIRDGAETLATINQDGDLNINIIGMGVEGQLLGGVIDPVIDLTGTSSSESEPNGTQATADHMGLNMDGIIGMNPVDNDWFYFEVLRDGVVTITKARTGGEYSGIELDLVWTIRQGSTTIATGSGSGSFNVNPGTYHISLTAPQGLSGIDYYDLDLSAMSSTEYATRYFIKDHLGSTRAIIDEAATHLTSYDYYPFGLVMPGRSSNSANPNDDIKFTAYEFDDEGGLKLYYAGARMYDPVIGRFMSIDRFYDMYPSMSPYQYAANNPINFIDINGDSVYQITDIAVTRALGLNNSHHAYLLLVPDDLEAFSKSDHAHLLQEYSFENENGERVTRQGIIVGAGPSMDGGSGQRMGLLEARTNAGEDPENKQTGTVLINPGDQTDHEFITNILDNHTNYLDRQQTPGLVPSYSLPPPGEVNPFGSERTTNLNGYNSNSYVSGIIKASGGIPNNPNRKTPLYNNPVPSHYFLPYKVTYK